MFVWLQRLDQHFPVRYSAWLSLRRGHDAGGLLLDRVRPRRHARADLLALTLLACAHPPDAPCGAAQLPGDRPPALPARVHPARDAAVLHRGRQRGRAVLAPAALAGLPARQRATPTSAPSARRWTCTRSATSGSTTRCSPASSPRDFRVTIGAGRASRTTQRVQHLGDELRRARPTRSWRSTPGARRGGFAHDTGEGSISRHHRANGGDLIWEIGSGYFGCRHGDGSFSERASPRTPACRR